MTIEFKEAQKFTQWWLWLMLVGIGILPIFGMYKQFILGEKSGDKPMSDLGLLLFSISVFIFIILFWTLRLKTNINQNEICISFFPFVKKNIPWKSVKSANVINYGFVGGWGIRLWTKYGTVYNVKGQIGLAIELLNGKKILIGTQKDTELNEFLKKIRNQEAV